MRESKGELSGILIFNLGVVKAEPASPEQYLSQLRVQQWTCVWWATVSSSHGGFLLCLIPRQVLAGTGVLDLVLYLFPGPSWGASFLSSEENFSFHIVSQWIMTSGDSEAIGETPLTTFFPCSKHIWIHTELATLDTVVCMMCLYYLLN
jgi:hypothetical protein